MCKSVLVCVLVLSTFPWPALGAGLEPPTLKFPGFIRDSVMIYALKTATPTMLWNPVPGADRYGLYISKDKVLVYENEQIRGDARSLLIPAGKLDPVGKYKWNMRAFRGREASAFSKVFHFRIKASEPSNPSSGPPGASTLAAPTLKFPGFIRDTVMFHALKTATPTMLWNPVPGADRYGLYISKDKVLVYENEQIRGDARSLLIPAGKLDPVGKYKWNMRAFRGGEASAFSKLFHFRIKASEPLNPSSGTSDAPPPAGQPCHLVSATGAVAWAKAESGHAVQPCKTPGCLYNRGAPGGLACKTPTASDDGDPRNYYKDGHVGWWFHCLRFVSMAYGQGGLYESPKDLHTKNRVHFSTSSKRIPLGALLVWKSGKFGHIAIHIGRGRVIHTGAKEKHLGVRTQTIHEVDKVLGLENWLGWIDPTATPLNWRRKSK